MKYVSAITLFCDDIREEVDGAHTVVGILPDSVLVPQIPSFFPKLAIYTRILLPPDLNPGTINFYLKFPDNSEHQFGTIPKEGIDAAIADAHEKKYLGIGLLLKAKTLGMPITQEGKIIAIVRSELGEQISGSLIVKATKS